MRCGAVPRLRATAGLRQPRWLHHKKNRNLNFRARMTNDEARGRMELAIGV
jgi:hypothetical protein